MGVVDKALWLIETNLHGPLTLALDAGYASPEAFSRAFRAFRAFRAEFGHSPRALRVRNTLADLPLTQALELTPIMSLIFDAPIFDTLPAQHRRPVPAL